VDAIEEGSGRESPGKRYELPRIAGRTCDSNLWAESFTSAISAMCMKIARTTWRKTIAVQVRAELSPELKAQLRSARINKPRSI